MPRASADACGRRIHREHVASEAGPGKPSASTPSPLANAACMSFDSRVSLSRLGLVVPDDQPRGVAVGERDRVHGALLPHLREERERVVAVEAAPRLQCIGCAHSPIIHPAPSLRLPPLHGLRRSLATLEAVRLADLPPLLRDEPASRAVLGRSAATCCRARSRRGASWSPASARLSSRRPFLVALPTEHRRRAARRRPARSTSAPTRSSCSRRGRRCRSSG